MCVGVCIYPYTYMHDLTSMTNPTYPPCSCRVIQPATSTSKIQESSTDFSLACAAYASLEEASMGILNLQKTSMLIVEASIYHIQTWLVVTGT